MHNDRSKVRLIGNYFKWIKFPSQKTEIISHPMRKNFFDFSQSCQTYSTKCGLLCPSDKSNLFFFFLKGDGYCIGRRALHVHFFLFEIHKYPLNNYLLMCCTSFLCMNIKISKVNFGINLVMSSRENRNWLKRNNYIEVV